jgi:abhydrolase domain-containing protein 12
MDLQNAGHIAQAIRPGNYHMLTDNSNYHVLAVDYRGFGRSTGKPTESTLIIDGVAAVKWATEVAGVAPGRIVLMGQSLGTAVASAVANHFAIQGVEFAGIILVAGFSNLPALLAKYAGAGFIPVLSPLRPFPPVLRFFQGFIADKWKSAERLANVVASTRNRLRLTILHAKNDLEIPCSESDILFQFATSSLFGQGPGGQEFDSWKEQRTKRRNDGTFIAVATGEPDIVVREELVPHGGEFRPLNPPLFEIGLTLQGTTTSCCRRHWL